MKYILGEVAQDVFVYYFSRHSLYEVSFLYATTTAVQDIQNKVCLYVVKANI